MAVTPAAPRCGKTLEGHGIPRAFLGGDPRVVRKAEQTVEAGRRPSGRRVPERRGRNEAALDGLRPGAARAAGERSRAGATPSEWTPPCSSAEGTRNLERGAPGVASTFQRGAGPRGRAGTLPWQVDRSSRGESPVVRSSGEATPRECGEGQAERLKVRTVAANRCAATRGRADPEEPCNTTHGAPPGNRDGAKGLRGAGQRCPATPTSRQRLPACREDVGVTRCRRAIAVACTPGSP